MKPPNAPRFPNLRSYYCTHEEDALQRRCYWLLEGDDGAVLVHYLRPARGADGWQLPREEVTEDLLDAGFGARVDRKSFRRAVRLQ